MEGYDHQERTVDFQFWSDIYGTENFFILSRRFIGVLMKSNMEGRYTGILGRMTFQFEIRPPTTFNDYEESLEYYLKWFRSLVEIYSRMKQEYINHAKNQHRNIRCMVINFELFREEKFIFEIQTS